MLNRLYIIVGVLAILALAAAFVVPAFIPWGQYRDRLAAIASEVLGEPVRIEGDIAFTLLPQPRLEFSGVSAGPPEAPGLTIRRVEADFSLIDFLRDRYNVTRLELEGPAVAVRIAADGTLQTGLAIAPSAQSNISIADALISDGSLSLLDDRSGKTYAASAIAGELKLETLSGPFSFQGNGSFEGASYGLRLTTGQLDADGGAPLSASLRPADEHFSLAAEGRLLPGTAPAFSGTMEYRQPPPPPAEGTAADAGQGDLVMTSKVEASAARILLSDYVVIPDENRAATRLLGAAEVTLGAGQAFNAVISGGLIALPPRDATAEQAVEPYELVRLLRELPLPAAPGMPGTVGIDISELNLRAFSLRNVRLDADAHQGGWTIRQFTGQLPGQTELRLAGEVTTSTGHPEFSGTLSLASAGLDALTTLWRKPAPGNPLFGMPGGIEARLDLVGETLSVSDGKLTLDGEARGFSAQIGFGTTRDIHLSADLGALDQARTEALLALLPDLGADPAFAVTFPKGEFELLADDLAFEGLSGKALSARGSWDGGVLVVDDFSAGDLGGARLKLAFTAFGTLARPELSGNGTVTVAAADAPLLGRLYDLLQVSPPVRAYLAASYPADIAVRLAAPSGNGAQSLSLSGRLASSEVAADAELEAGFLRALSGSVKVQLDMKSADPAAMTAQLGLGDISLVGDTGPLHLVGLIDGNVANSLETTLLVENGNESLGFSGNVVVTDPAAFSGKGTVKARLADPSALADRLGAGGIWLPGIEATATLAFDGASSASLTGIKGSSGGTSFGGNLALRGAGETSAVTGSIDTDSIDIASLLGVLAGPAALLQSPPDLWPDGPLATGDAARRLTGRIEVTSDRLTSGARELARNLAFGFDWDATATRLRALSAEIGAGKLGLELGICCSGPLPDKQVSGRVTLTGVRLADILPPAAAGAIGARLDASGRFEATGGSVAAILSAMTGEGTYTLSDLSIARLDPRAIDTATGLEGLVEMQPEQVKAALEQRLDDAPFASPSATGSFTIAGGVLRSPNLSISGPAGELFGSGSIRLADLGLNASYTLGSKTVDPALIDPGAARVTASLGGTLLSPQRSFDVSGLVDALMVKAYETEVARLEKLRAEDEARRQAEAAEQARIEAEQKAAAEAAKKAADEEAARRAAEEAARPTPVPPLDLGLPPAN